VLNFDFRLFLLFGYPHHSLVALSIFFFFFRTVTDERHMISNTLVGRKLGYSLRMLLVPPLVVLITIIPHPFDWSIVVPLSTTYTILTAPTADDPRYLALM